MTREEREIIEAIKIMGYDRTDYPREKVSAVISMAIEALQGDMYCSNCGARLVQEDEYLEPTQTHGRLIDADALMKELSDIQPYNWTESEAEIQEDADYSLFKSLINDAPTVQADRPHGEWVEVVERTEQYDREGVKTWATLYQCSNCGFVLNAIEGHIGQYDFCPNCGCVMDMRGGDTE